MTFVRPRGRILERTTTSGAGPFTLAGVPDASYNDFDSFMADGDTTYAAVVEPGVCFWCGIARFNTGPNRITLLQTEEINGSFGSGTKEIFAGALASSSVLREDISGSITTGGNSTAFTVASFRKYVNLAAMDGSTIAFTPHATSGVTPTLAVDGLAAKPIRHASGATLPTGALRQGAPYRVKYDDANNEFVLLNQMAIVPDNAVVTASLANNAVTYAKMQDVSATARLLGRATAGAGDAEELSIAGGLSFVGAALKSSTIPPTITRLTSGSGTYTTPLLCVGIRVRVVGGGSGGGGGNNSSPASAGGASTFSGTGVNLSAGGGAAGAAAVGSATAGGAASGGNVANIPGGSGQGPSGSANSSGGSGGSSALGGGGGGGGGGNNGAAGATNSGGGGGGGGSTGATSSGGGGGAGGYVEHYVTGPAATYSYAVGAGGSGVNGSSAGNGAAGATGIIIVEEYY